MRNKISYMVLILGLVGATAGYCLATVKDLTDPIIEARILNEKVKPGLEVFFRDIAPDNDAIADRVIVDLGRDERGRARRLTVFPAMKDGKLVAAALRTSAGGFGGSLEVMTALDLREDRLLGVRTLSQSETKGLGARVANDEEPFITQFPGLPWRAGLSLRADGGQVEAITGATISSKALTSAVDGAGKLLQERLPEVQQATKARPKGETP
jgi:Na+-translocating ferredoxin:NAD+ oxidoreductase subunit G